MKIDLKLFRTLTCGIYLLANIENVQAEHRQANCVEIFYDNIQKIAQSPQKVLKEEIAIVNEAPVQDEMSILRENKSQSDLPDLEKLLSSNNKLSEQTNIEEKNVDIIFADSTDLTIPPLYNGERLELPKETPQNLLVDIMPKDSSPLIKREEAKKNLVKNIKRKSNTAVRNTPKATALPKSTHVNQTVSTTNQMKEIDKNTSLLPQKESTSVPLMSVDIPLGAVPSDTDEIKVDTIVDQPSIKEDYNSIKQEKLDDLNQENEASSINNSNVQSMQNVEILPDEATPTIELKKEISFEEKLKKIQEENGISQAEPVKEVKTWKNYIPFFKKKNTQKPSANSIHIEKFDDNEKLPSLPGNLLEDEIEIQEQDRNSSLGDSKLNLSLGFDNREIEITSENKERIDQLILQSKRNHSKLKVIGYSDQENGESRRLTLQRVINIRQYLINNGFLADSVSVQVLPANFQTGELAGIVNFFLLENNG